MTIQMTAEVDIRWTVTEYIFLSIETQTVAIIKLEEVECFAENLKIFILIMTNIM